MELPPLDLPDDEWLSLREQIAPLLDGKQVLVGVCGAPVGGEPIEFFEDGAGDSAKAVVIASLFANPLERLPREPDDIQQILQKAASHYLSQDQVVYLRPKADSLPPSAQIADSSALDYTLMEVSKDSVAHLLIQAMEPASLEELVRSPAAEAAMELPIPGDPGKAGLELVLTERVGALTVAGGDELEELGAPASGRLMAWWLARDADG